MIVSHNYRYTLKNGLKGHDVMALQSALNSFGNSLVEDGSFGDATERIVKVFQANRDMTIDGIAGPATQRRIAIDLATKIATVLPPGLLQGLIEGESGYSLGCANFSVPGGFDAGLLQERVYDSEFSKDGNGNPIVNDRIRAAFDVMTSLAKLAGDLRKYHDLYYGRLGAETHKRAWQLAVLHHNWPVASEKWSRGNMNFSYIADDANGVAKTYRMDDPAQWVINIGVPNIDTGTEWANYYVNSKMTYVTSFPA